MQTITLQVSNQSFEIDPVEIEVLIDRQVVVQDRFALQDASANGGLPQHNWKNFTIQLVPGSHHLLARSPQADVQHGSAQETAEFEVPETETITVAFWSERRNRRGELEHYLTVSTAGRPAATM